jgi:hypothetical protein
MPQRRRSIVLSHAALLIALAACGDREAGADKLEDLTAGMSTDSLYASLGAGPLTATGADTVRVRNGWRLSRYFVEGKLYEVIYVRDIPGDVTEPVEQQRETPIVVAQDGKVLGWGWRFYVEEGINRLHLPTPLSEKVPASNTPTAP